jgi:dipeptidyl-peptidase-4
MLVDSLKLSSGRVLSEAEKMQRERQRIGDLKGIVSYDWASDSKTVLVPLDGELLLAGLDGTVRKVAGMTGAELNPRLGPQGDWIAFVRDRGCGSCRSTASPARAITPEERPTVHWGEAEFVAQEELARMSGFWWSPDEKRLAVERFDEAGWAW